jgi:integrase
MLEEPGAGAVLCRAVLDRLSRTLDGSPAAANTANRNRMVLNNLLEYACEIGALSENPLRKVKWTKPRTAESVDPRSVVNATQARQLLAAVEAQGKLGQHLVAFFGLMYYAALRPEEAVCLRTDQLRLPDEGWGEVLLTNATPYVGSQWTDDGKARQERGLKHRATGDTRRVPLHPELVALLKAHIEREGTRHGGLLFRGPRGGMLGTTTYGNVWRRARVAVFGEAEAARSLLARRPYELRHACVSTWLAAGVPAPQVAEWAGHSVAVLLRVYAKCIAGQADQALRRILEVTSPGDEPAA